MKQLLYFVSILFLSSCASIGTQDDFKSMYQSVFVFEELGGGLYSRSFKISVFGDGNFIYTGDFNVAKKGIYSGSFKNDEFNNILKTLEEYNFLELEGSYITNKEDGCKKTHTDSKTIRFYLQNNGELKTVYHYYGCKGFKGESELKELAIKIENILGINKWMNNY